MAENNDNNHSHFGFAASPESSHHENEDSDWQSGNGKTLLGSWNTGDDNEELDRETKEKEEVEFE